MRQRKIKNLDEKLLKYADFQIEDPANKKGCMARVFREEKPLFLEIGCGKGQFINDLAELNKENNYVAIEGSLSVVLRALEKTEARELNNVKYILQYIDNVEDFFKENELDGIYLNFSDPWPKDRHAKRRLTYGKRLLQYASVVKPEGFIQFKTDNDGLFDFTLEEIEKTGLEIIEISRDLHNSPYMEKNVMTEYENKFSKAGKNINYVRIRAL